MRCLVSLLTGRGLGSFAAGQLNSVAGLSWPEIFCSVSLVIFMAVMFLWTLYRVKARPYEDAMVAALEGKVEVASSEIKAPIENL